MSLTPERRNQIVCAAQRRLYGSSLDADGAVEAVKYWLDHYKQSLKDAQEQVRKLREEYDKDEEVSKLKKHIESLEEESRNGFPITKEENEKIREWQQKHVKEKHEGNSYAGAIGGNYTYEFVPTSIGTIGTVKCSCGEEFCFQEID